MATILSKIRRRLVKIQTDIAGVEDDLGRYDKAEEKKKRLALQRLHRLEERLNGTSTG